VAVIEIKDAKVATARETLDALVVHGHGADHLVLEEAGIKDADMLIALAATDEQNILACQMAAHYGVDQKIARIRNPHFFEKKGLISLKDWGVDHVIQPELETAKEIVLLIKRSAATDVLEFADGKIQVVGIRLDPQCPVLHKTIESVSEEFREHTYRVVAILRNNRTIVPTGKDHLMPRDQIFIMAEPGEIKNVVQMMGKSEEKLEKIFVLGGGKVGRATAHLLEGEKGLEIKLIESNPERTLRLAEELRDTLIIQGDGRDFDLLAREGVVDADALISTTNDEETNILTCLLSKHLGVAKTIALINRDEYMPIMGPIGVNAAVNKNIVTSNTILRLIRRGNVVSIAMLPGVDAEIMEYQVFPKSKIMDMPLSKINFPKGTIVGAVIRNGEVLVPVGNTTLHQDDRVVIFTQLNAIHDVDKIFGR
jgi:trk system potassium uptake protein TrkA